MRQLPTRSLASVPRSLLMLSLILLSGGFVLVAGKSPVTAASSNLVAQSSNLGNAAELEQLRREADLAFNRATTLFFVLLGTLILLLGVGVAMLWLMRRSVIQEVSEVVRNQLNDITDLETKIQSATRDLDYILSQANEKSTEISTRTNRFQEEAVTKKQVLNRLVDDLAEFKARTLNDWQSTLANLQVKLESVEADFVGHLSGLRQQADEQVTTLRKETQLQRDAVFRVLEENQSGFLRDVNRIKSDVDVQQDAVKQKLDHAEAGFTDRLTRLTTGVEEERDRVLSVLGDLRNQLNPHLELLKSQASEQIERQSQTIGEDLNRQRSTSLEQLQGQTDDIRSHLDELQASAYGHKDLAT